MAVTKLGQKQEREVRGGLRSRCVPACQVHRIARSARAGCRSLTHTAHTRAAHCHTHHTSHHNATYVSLLLQHWVHVSARGRAETVTHSHKNACARSHARRHCESSMHRHSAPPFGTGQRPRQLVTCRGYKRRHRPHAATIAPQLASSAPPPPPPPAAPPLAPRLARAYSSTFFT